MQIGIKNDALIQFNDTFIVSVQDVPEFVIGQKKLLDTNNLFGVIAESVVEINQELRQNFGTPHL